MTIGADFGSIHCRPPVPPSVPTGSPTVVVADQPHMDRVLLEKEASNKTICTCRRTWSLGRGVLHRLAHVTRRSKQSILWRRTRNSRIGYVFGAQPTLRTLGAEKESSLLVPWERPYVSVILRVASHVLTSEIDFMRPQSISVPLDDRPRHPRSIDQTSESRYPGRFTSDSVTRTDTVHPWHPSYVYHIQSYIIVRQVGLHHIRPWKMQST